MRKKLDYTKKTVAQKIISYHQISTLEFHLMRTPFEASIIYTQMSNQYVLKDRIPKQLWYITFSLKREQNKHI